MQKVNEYNFTQLGDTVVFLISGKAGTGKSFSAEILMELVNRLNFIDFTTMHFATGVKDVAKRSFGWDGKKDQKGRRLLQEVGQTGRHYDEDMWAKQVARKIYSNPGMYDFVFIDDWRFPNEFYYLDEHLENTKVISVRIVAPEREILKGTPEYDEESETSLPEDRITFNFVIDNSGDKKHLATQLNKMLHKVIQMNIGG